MKLLSLLFNQVTYEGWHKMWESGPHGLPEADIRWLKEDAERGLFQPQMSFEDKHKKIRKRKVLKSDRMWFYPPEFPGVVVGGGVPSADSFFHGRVFFWRPVGVWGYSLQTALRAILWPKYGGRSRRATVRSTCKERTSTPPSSASSTNLVGSQVSQTGVVSFCFSV